MNINILIRVKCRPTCEDLFIDGGLKVYDKKSIISLINQRKIGNLFLIKRGGKEYIKSKPNSQIIDNIICKSISHTELISFCKNYTLAMASSKIKSYDEIKRSRQGETRIVVNDEKGKFISTKTVEDVANHLKKYKSIIAYAAKKQRIDPILLGAILIDEYCRMGWDDWFDWIGALSLKDASIGVAQIKLSTAREIIRKKYYNPAPGKITETSPPFQIWFYLNKAEHSIQFAAAAIRLSIDYWRAKKNNISNNLKVLAYLYSKGHTKDIKGATTRRCLQISNEFYRLAKSLLL